MALPEDPPVRHTIDPLEVRNLGPRPVTVDIVEWRFYSALIGPSADVNWLGPGPDGRLTLMRFTAQTYGFGLRVIPGLKQKGLRTPHLPQSLWTPVSAKSPRGVPAPSLQAERRGSQKRLTSNAPAIRLLR